MDVTIVDHRWSIEVPGVRDPVTTLVRTGRRILSVELTDCVPTMDRAPPKSGSSQPSERQKCASRR